MEPPHLGYNLRTLTGYDGSILDGVPPEGNIVDDPRTWSDSISEDEASEVEAAADSLLNGTDRVGARFLQGEGPVLHGVFSDFSMSILENPRLSPSLGTMRNDELIPSFTMKTADGACFVMTATDFARFW